MKMTWKNYQMKNLKEWFKTIQRRHEYTPKEQNKEMNGVRKSIKDIKIEIELPRLKQVRLERKNSVSQKEKKNPSVEPHQYNGWGKPRIWVADKAVEWARHSVGVKRKF